MTDSLDRSGKGGMLAPVRTPDGTNAAPAFSFTSESGTGLYRVGTNDLGLAVGGAKLMDWTTLENMTIAGSASTTVAQWLQASLADGNNMSFYYGKSLVGGGTGITTYTKNATAANSTLCYGIFGGSASTLCVDGNDKVLSHSLTIGSTGTAISSSLRATTTADPANMIAGTGTSVAITVTGAAAGADCIPVVPNGLNTGITITCAVTADTCTVKLFNPTAGAIDPVSATWGCRVFNP